MMKALITFSLLLATVALAGELTCPPGAKVENEPAIARGYVDTYNNGCDWNNPNPPHFTPIMCGDVMFGTAEFYQSPYGYMSDMDWYQLLLDKTAPLNWTITAEFAVNVTLYAAGEHRTCDEKIVVAKNEAPAMQTATVTAILEPGTYWLKIQPQSVVPHNAHYITSVTGCGSALDNVLSVNSVPATVNTYALYQNYPNPFNPTTRISFDMPRGGPVTLKVYNPIGQEVASLVNGNLGAGSHVVTWDASNFTSGLYLYRLVAGTFAAERKMLLLK
jgi:hypothetical protein